MRPLLPLLLLFLRALAGVAVAQPGGPAAGLGPVRQIAPHLYALWLEGPYHNKVVLAEFADYVAVLEAPQGDSVGRLIAAAAQRTLPGKPVRYVFHTHPHDHSVGPALGPLLSQGAALVTSPANLPAARRLSRDSLPPGPQLHVLTDSTWALRDGLNELRAYVLPRSRYAVPTPEYLVFYFPRQRVLVSGCLYNKPLGYHEIVNGRKLGLKRFLDRHRLRPRRLVPTNTTRASGFADFGSYRLLQQSLRRGLPGLQTVAYFRQTPLPVLAGRRDSLRASYRRRLGRAYDLVVVGNQLLQQKQYAQAEFVLTLDRELFPQSADPCFYLGLLYAAQDDRPRAEQFFRQALALDPALTDARAELDKLRAGQPLR